MYEMLLGIEPVSLTKHLKESVTVPHKTWFTHTRTLFLLTLIVVLVSLRNKLIS